VATQGLTRVTTTVTPISYSRDLTPAMMAGRVRRHQAQEETDDAEVIASVLHLLAEIDADVSAELELVCSKKM
jgi:hypothetical protein